MVPELQPQTVSILKEWESIASAVVVAVATAQVSKSIV
jgi:hypothetical protein